MFMSSSPASRIMLVTGANSGLGRATALGLACDGATVIMICRDAALGAAAQAAIIRESGNPAVDLIIADLSSQHAIRQLAQTVLARYPQLHGLINNVGASFPTRRVTVDGIESSLAINHLAAFLLTNLLCDRLIASAPARIINVGTRITTRMDFDDLQFEKRPYRALAAYSQTKLGTIHFTYELARRLAGTGVTVNCVHPGVFKSRLGQDDGRQSWFFRMLGLLGQYVLPDAAQAAKQIVYLATSPAVADITGSYFAAMRPISSPPQTYDRAANARLWDLSATLTKLDTEGE